MELMRFYFYYFMFFLLFSFHLQIITTEKFAQMPNCNLDKSIHNKWFQESGYKGGNLYVATMDDYIRAFFQVMLYHQFLKGGIGDDGPNKEKLKL